jgi:HlyD family secretion protein
MTGRWIIAAFVTLALGAGVAAIAPLATTLFSSPSVQPAEPQLQPVTAVQAIGYTEPISELRQLTLDVDGVINKCHVTVGQPVGRGELLIELESSAEQAAVALSDADVALAEAELAQLLAGVNPYSIQAAERERDLLAENQRHAQQEHDRLRSLSRTVVSAEQMDKAESQLRQTKIALARQEAELLQLRNFVREEDVGVARAKVAAARARLQLAEKQLERTRLRAPFDGVVLELLKREGDGLRMGDPRPVAVFADVSRLRVRAEVDERHAVRIRRGQSATIFGRNLGQQRFPGKVERVKSLMGDKTVFTNAPDERKDLDVREVLIDMDEGFTAPVGLRVDVAIDIGDDDRIRDGIRNGGD